MVSLSNAEWKVMDYLWDESPKTIQEMVRHFEGSTNWDRHVLIMMLKRMEAKNAVSHNMKGRSKQFYPIVERNQVSLQETEDFLKRVYKGSIGMMLTTMVKQEKISEEEIRELREILKAKE